MDAWNLVALLQVPSVSSRMSRFRVVCAMLLWTKAALKGPRFAKGLSRCSQPSHHGHPAAVGGELRLGIGIRTVDAFAPSSSQTCGTG